jgi:hypothetical protein
VPRDAVLHVVEVSRRALLGCAVHEHHIAQATSAIGVRHDAVQEQVPQVVGRTQPLEAGKTRQCLGSRAQVRDVDHVHDREVDVHRYGLRDETGRHVRRGRCAFRVVTALIQEPGE